MVWVLGAVALGSGGELRQAVQRSYVLQRLNTILPPTSGLLNALENLDPFPRIDGPEVRVQAPAAGIVGDPQVDAAARSVVKVLGTACGLGVEGSGWVAGDGLVVTNAHVVAGQEDTRVLLRGRRAGLDARGRRTSTRATTSRCCACRGLQAPALPLAASPRAGHLGGRPRLPAQRALRRARRPARARRARSSPRTPTAAARCGGSITSLRGAVRSGNSGGPMVDGRGRVVTTIFAATTSGPRGGYGVPNAVVRAALGDARGPVSTGPLRLSAPGRPATLDAAMAKTLVLAEKPSVGRDLTRALPGQFAKHEGYLESDSHVVTWAVGHLVQLAEPDEYDAKYKKWRMADLPIVPDDFRLVVRDERSRKQMTVITRLLQRKDVDDVVNACDAGREGELIFAWTLREVRRRASPSSGCGCPR